MWPSVINTALGIWLIAAPAALAYGGAQATSDRIIGPVIAALAWIATSRCTRAVRWWLMPLAAWLLISPFILDAPTAAVINHPLCAIAIAALASIRGKVDQPYGGGWRVLFQHDPYAVHAAAHSNHTQTPREASP